MGALAGLGSNGSGARSQVFKTRNSTAGGGGGGAGSVFGTSHNPFAPNLSRSKSIISEEVEGLKSGGGAAISRNRARGVSITASILMRPR